MESLVHEVLRGEHKKDKLLDSSLDFSKERQAQHFSNMRRNMASVIAHTIYDVEWKFRELESVWTVADNK